MVNSASANGAKVEGMQCQPCGDAMEREIVAIEIVIAGRRVSIDQPGWYCWSCKLGTHSVGDLALVDDSLAALLGKRRQLRPGKTAVARRG
jgi:hypothetical protein